MKIFKIEAHGDTLYFKAKDEEGAKEKLFDFVGEEVL